MEQNQNNETNNQELNNQEPTNQAPADNQSTQQPKSGETNEVTIKVHPAIAKGLRIGKKVLKVAVPFALAAGAAFGGYELGKTGEKKRSSGAISDLQSQVDLLKLEQKPIEVPPVPVADLFEAVKDTAENVVEF